MQQIDKAVLTVRLKYGFKALSIGYGSTYRTGGVRAEPRVRGISWTALALEVGKPPAEVTCGRQPRAHVTSVGDRRVHFVVEP